MEQVSAILTQLTDPNVSDEDKAKLVDGGLTPAINDLAGVTVALTGPKDSAPVVAPLVLVDHDGTWQLTHDSYDPTFVNMARRVIKHVTWRPYDGGNVAVFGW